VWHPSDSKASGNIHHSDATQNIVRVCLFLQAPGEDMADGNVGGQSRIDTLSSGF